MDSNTLQWPGLWDVETYLIDSDTKKVYGKDRPLPPHKQYLNNVGSKRYVRLSTILDLFPINMRDEAEFMLRNLQCAYDIGKPVHSSVSRSKSATKSGRLKRKVTTYIPTVAVMAFAIIWPCCKAFQTMRHAILNHLDTYSESVCMDCGYVHRDCSCLNKTNKSSNASGPLTFVGHAVTHTDTGIQTDPMVVVGMPQKLPAQSGISVLLPQGMPGLQSIQLPAGLKIPISLPQSCHADSNTWSSPGFISLPSTLALPVGSCTQTLFNPVAGTAEFPVIDVHGAGLSMASWVPAPGQSLISSPATPGISFLRPPTTFSSSNIVYRISGDSIDTNSNRKRRLSTGESYAVAHAGVQTTAKSFIKKMKLRLGKLMVDGAAVKVDDTGDGRISVGAGLTSQLNSQQHGILLLNDVRDGDRGPLDVAGRKDSKVDIAAAAAAAAAAVAAEKKCATVWRLLDEDSEDELVESDGKKNSELADSQTSTADVTANDSTASADVFTPDLKNEASTSSLVSAAEMSKSILDKLDGDVDVSGVSLLAAAAAAAASLEQASIRVSEPVTALKSPLSSSNESTEPKSTIGSATAAVAAEAASDVDDMDTLMIDESVDENGQTKTNLHGPVNGTGTAAGTLLSGSEVDSSVFRMVDLDNDDVSHDLPSGIKAADEMKTGGSSVPGGDGSTGVVDGSGNTDVVGSSSLVQTETMAAEKVKRVYGKFEYTPTGEHVLRCLIPKCSQTFDTKTSAELHNHVHPGCGSALVTVSTGTPGGGVGGSGEGDTPGGTTYFQCHRCEFQAPFYHWYDLLRHLRLKHCICLEDKSKMFTCEYCGLGFDTLDLLSSHIDFHYNNRYKCIYCGLLLLTWTQVQRHVEACPERTKQHRSTTGMNLGCPFCTFVFHKKNIRNLHLLSHVDAGLACALCDDGVVWNDWKSLRKHYQQKHSKMLLEKISPFGQDLPNRQPPLRCTRSGCDVTFKSMSVYTNHMCRTHDLVPFTLVECVQCERRFRTEKSHEWHVRHMHGEERLCDKCDFVASSKAMLKLHVSQKHQEKQHTCTECDKSFLYFHQLRVHMAHHARRSIYPCRRCDQEFSRHADLRQHLRYEHKQLTMDGDGDMNTADSNTQECPECEFTAPTRSLMMQHVRKCHPELTEGGTESDGHEHSYFSRNSATPATPISPTTPTLAPAVPTTPGSSLAPLLGPEDPPPVVIDGASPVRGYQHEPRYRVITRRGRRRRVYGAAEPAGRPFDRFSRLTGDRRERKLQKRIEKEQEDRLKRLRKCSCARSRSFQEHRLMARGGVASTQQLQESRGNDDGTDADGITDAAVMPLPPYPMLDHPYFREVVQDSAERLQALWKSGVNRQVPARSATGVYSQGTPEVSAFQECETMLLGLSSPTGRGMVTRGRPRGRGRGSSRGGYVMEHRPSGVMVPPDDLEQLDPTIRDLDLLAESELLLRPGSDYSILQDILGPNCVSAARPSRSAVVPSATGFNPAHGNSAGYQQSHGYRQPSLLPGYHMPSAAYRQSHSAVVPYQQLHSSAGYRPLLGAVGYPQPTSSVGYQQPVGSANIQHRVVGLGSPSPAKATHHQRPLLESPRARNLGIVGGSGAVSTDNTLSDSLPLDETAPSDLDDIELCEDDYRLFDPHIDQQPSRTGIVDHHQQQQQQQQQHGHQTPLPVDSNGQDQHVSKNSSVAEALECNGPPSLDAIDVSVSSAVTDDVSVSAAENTNSAATSGQQLAWKQGPAAVISSSNIALPGVVLQNSDSIRPSSNTLQSSHQNCLPADRLCGPAAVISMGGPSSVSSMCGRPPVDRQHVVLDEHSAGSSSDEDLHDNDADEELDTDTASDIDADL